MKPRPPHTEESNEALESELLAAVVRYRSMRGVHHIGPTDVLWILVRLMGVRLTRTSAPYAWQSPAKAAEGAREQPNRDKELKGGVE